jgi:hypothetical protein
VALAIADLLRVLRPTLTNPQGYADDGAKLLAGLLLFGPFMFGAFKPFSVIFMRLCDSQLRKSYSAFSRLKDLSWYAALGTVVFLSFRYVWV